MPKVNKETYSPKHVQARIRGREAEYIRQVAEQYNERFIDALYRIINVHRDASLNKVTPVMQVVNTASSCKTAVETEEIEIEMNLDDFL
jgi:hypothetical protein